MRGGSKFMSQQHCQDHATSYKDHTTDMPPDTHIVQERDDLHAENIQESMDNQHSSVNAQCRPLGSWINSLNRTQCRREMGEPGIEQDINGYGQTIIGASGDSYLTNQVKPACKPTPTSTSQF